MKNILCILLIILIATSVIAQSRVDIRFNATELATEKTCLDFEIKSLENTDVLLAGQNYRIFFNPEKVTLDAASVSSYNDKSQYSGLNSLAKHHSDEIDITMINLAEDALEYDSERLTVLKPNQWTQVSSACFIHKKNAQFDLQWARPKRTGDLATAFVELSEWKSANDQEAIEINEYFDFDNGNIDNQSLFTPQISVYPNPVVDLLNFDIGPFSELDNAEMVIVDASGKQIDAQTITKGISSYQFDLKKAPVGSYFVEILNESKRSVFHSSFVKTAL